MRGPVSGLPGDIDPCGLAILLAVVVALASIADEALGALVVALVALGLGAFLIGLRPHHAGRLVIDAPTVFAFSMLALGTIAYFRMPSSFEPVRALFFALSATPLWWVNRTGPRAPAGDRA